MAQTKRIKLNQLRCDRGTQQRQPILSKVKEYAEMMRDGIKFPPIGVVYDGIDYIIWDGFHRYMAACEIEAEAIDCSVENGDLKKAKLLSYGANKAHGIPLTREDRRNIIVRMLKDPDCAGMTFSQIAETVGVSVSTVNLIAKEIKDTGEGKSYNIQNVCYRSPAVQNKKSEETSFKKEEEAEEETYYDEEGNEVPEHLIPIFQRRAEIEQYIKTLNEMLRQIRAKVSLKDRLYAFLPLNPLEVEIANVKRVLRFAMPHAVCKYCHAKDKNCNACKGLGFVTERIYKATPEELKE